MGNVLFFRQLPVSMLLYHLDSAASIGIRLRCQEPVEPEQRI